MNKRVYNALRKVAGGPDISYDYIDLDKKNGWLKRLFTGDTYDRGTLSKDQVMQILYASNADKDTTAKLSTDPAFVKRLSDRVIKTITEDEPTWSAGTGFGINPRVTKLKAVLRKLNNKYKLDLVNATVVDDTGNEWSAYTDHDINYIPEIDQIYIEG